MSPSTSQSPSFALDHRQHSKSLEVVLSSEDETMLSTLLLPVVGHSLASNCRVTCGGKRGRCGLLWRTRDPVVVASPSFVRIVASRISSGFYQAPPRPCASRGNIEHATPPPHASSCTTPPILERGLSNRRSIDP